MGSAYEKKRHVKMAFLLVLLALVLNQPFAMASIIVPIERWHVHVVSGLSNGTLFVHCKSKDDDLGSHYLASSGEEFQWTFKVNFWATTLFWCYLRKPYAYVSFEAFWVEKRHSWLNPRCAGRNCIWTAKGDGIYLRNNPEEFDEFVLGWKYK